MGSNLVRAVKNFNVESRAHRLIGKEKPDAAPMHPGTKETLQAAVSRHPDIQDKIHLKDEALLSRLKDVYVDSIKQSSEVKHEAMVSEQGEFRLPNPLMKNKMYGIDMGKIQKGNISVVEALTILNNHKQSPQNWTAEKIAEEYSLSIKDTQSLLEYFRPFDVKIIPPKDKEQIAEQ
ncbi:NADH dehydrogenase [ubiquinone] 1 alpha subcomplex assembly factor 4 [Mixophyes fleayi]|uniref:NADH dehydrogenase [ubiquinone] 1 alpha subcomplex assembly factor 4 n=1 Tax=Mixophyes fleayi TaxID=3061075 RepID=UPI003F4E40DF